MQATEAVAYADRRHQSLRSLRTPASVTGPLDREQKGAHSGQSAWVAFTFDQQPDVVAQECRSCGRPYEWVTGSILRDGDAFAVYYAQCHGHDEDEVWLDVVIGSWEEPAYTDHATFSCRVTQAGAGLVDAPAASEGQAPFSGSKLTRSAALADPRLPDLWDVVDFLVVADPTVRAHIGDGA